MSSEFLVFVIEMPTGRARMYGPALKRAMSVWRHRVDKLTAAMIVKSPERMESMQSYAIDEDPDRVPHILGTLLPGYKIHLHELLDSLDFDTNQELAVFKLRGRYYLIVGGMSYGDAPSHTYGVVEDLVKAGILLYDDEE